MSPGELSALTNVTFVVRLVVDGRRQVVHGTVVDQDGVAIGRFRALDEIAAIVAAGIKAARVNHGDNGGAATPQEAN